MNAIIILSVFILAVFSTCSVLLLSFVAIVAWWALLFFTAKYVCWSYARVCNIVVSIVKELEELMTNNIPAFLWYVVCPLLLLLYIYSILSCIEK